MSAEAENPSTVLDANELGVQALEGGRADQAIELLTRAHERLPDRRVLRRNLAAAYAAAAEQRRHARRFVEAIGLLDRAVELHPERLRYRYLRGVAHFALGRDADRFLAREDLEAVLAGDPDHVGALGFAGQLAYLERDLEGAVRAWTRALALDPEDRALRTRLTKARRELEVERAYTERRSAHFLVRHGEGVPAEFAERLLSLCERIYGELCLRFGYYPEAVTVVTLYTAEQFEAATRLHRWVAGLSDGTIRLTVSMPPSLERIRAALYHEFAHHLLRGIAARVPGWLHEGLAQQAEGRGVERAENRLRRSPNLRPAELSTGILRVGDPRVVARFYDLALAFTTYLERVGGERALQALLHGLGEGEAESNLFRAHFGASRDELFARWLEGLQG